MPPLPSNTLSAGFAIIPTYYPVRRLRLNCPSDGSDEFVVVYAFDPAVVAKGEVKLVIPSFRKEVGEGETGKSLPGLKITAQVER